MRQRFVPSLLTTLIASTGWACLGSLESGPEAPDHQAPATPTSGNRPPPPGQTPGAQPGPTSTVGTDGFTIACGSNKTCEGEDAPLRRLTNREYLNTVRDLLGVRSDPTATFATESVVDGFDNNATTQLATEGVSRQYHLAAAALAEEIQPRVQQLVSCDVAARGESGCMQAFIADFGTKAFRRPLIDEEKKIFEATYGKLRAAGVDHAESLATLVQTFLASPQFYYRMELSGLSDSAAKPGGRVRLNGWEIASRLSYFLWQTMPDADLMKAAQDDRLRTKDQIASQARRMLESPRGKEVVKRFFAQWFDLDAFADVAKDKDAYPQFTPQIKTLMAAEMEAFLEHTFWQEKGSLGALIAGPFALRNAALAAFYGDGLGTGQTMARVDLSGQKRRGLLTTAGMAAKLATQSDSDPVKRGLFVREKLLCGHVPDPPPGTLMAAPAKKPEQTHREYFDIHTNLPGCNSCHRMIDPVGLALENYDGIGRWRDTEKGKPIDSSGRWPAEDGGGTFADSVGMLESLSRNPRVYDCAVKTWFRYAMGRSEISGDLPYLTALYDGFRKNGSDMHALILDLVQADTFTTRAVAK